MSRHTPGVSIPLSDWCKLCDALSMQPESTIVDVLQKVDRLSRRMDAASDLLEACLAIKAWEDRPGSHDVAWPGTLHDAIDKARAAIAKARGES